MIKQATQNTATPLLNEHEVAHRINISVKTLRRWRWANKEIRWIKIGSAVRYDPMDVQQYIDRRKAIISGETTARAGE
jgi:predicted DNA-binding transcriptional regulator AlpA